LLTTLHSIKHTFQVIQEESKQTADCEQQSGNSGDITTADSRAFDAKLQWSNAHPRILDYVVFKIKFQSSTPTPCFRQNRPHLYFAPSEKDTTLYYDIHDDVRIMEKERDDRMSFEED